MTDNLGNIYSDKFKRWFGDWENSPQTASKVVDSNGMPLPVFHGTVMKGNDGMPFKAFKPESPRGEGVMFSDKYSVASFFAGNGEARFSNFSDKFDNYEDKDSIDGLVNFLNNVISDGKYSIEHLKEADYEMYRLEVKYDSGGDVSSPLGHSYEEAYRKLYKYVERTVYSMEAKSQYAYNGGVYKVYLSIRNPFIFDAKGSNFYSLYTGFSKNKINVFTLVSYVKETGKYDGVIVKNVRETTEGEGILTTDYIVFKPNQIKHALDNNGKYSDNEDMTESKLRTIIKESVREILSEGVETKNMKLAKHYLYDKKGFDEQKAMQCIGQIKTDIPNSRMGKCKFMLALVRMYCNGELSDGRTIMNVNKSLKYAASEAHINEYNNDLNGFTAQQLIDKFAVSAQQDLEQDRNELSSQQYDNNVTSQYQIVKIDTFDAASQYADYVSWCVTHYEDMYESYTNNGLGVFYFCLRNGWEDEPEVTGEDCPLDNYGLSMIAVSVNQDGSCNTITCRWNHDNGGNDNVMTTKELSQIIGRNFYDTFKPLSPEEVKQKQQEILYDIASEIDAKGLRNCRCLEYDPDYSDIIEEDVYVFESSEKNTSVLIDEFGDFIIDMTFDYVNYRYVDIIEVGIGRKTNFVVLEYNDADGIKGHLLSEQSFDYASNSFYFGYAKVKLNNKWNMIGRNGYYLLDGWHDGIGKIFKDYGFFFVEVVDNKKSNIYDVNNKTYLFDKSIVKIFAAYHFGVFIKFEGDDYYQVYDEYSLKLRAPWEIKSLQGYFGNYYYIELADGNRYLIDDNGNLYERGSENPVYKNPMNTLSSKSYLSSKNNNKLENIIHKVLLRTLNEVRYIDTKSEKYNGKVYKKDWTDVYNQEPITNNDKIRVFHGCDLKTACEIAISGTSGKVYHPRAYSYETGMNPLGIFVTTDLETAKKFGVSNSGMCVIEFTANASDLESPVWNGQNTYFVQGSNPMPFRNRDERNAQKQKYRQDALNTKDYEYYDYNKRQSKTFSKDYIRKSDKPEVADSIFNDAEHQALFMGDLNPNQIKRIWVKLPHEDGYVYTTDSYQPMSLREFLKKFKDKEWQDGYDHKGQPFYTKIHNNKIFSPNDDVHSFDELIDKVWSNKQDRGYFKTRENVEKNLRDFGLLQTPPPDYAYDTIKHMLWPKQIIQLYGKEYFDKNFDRLGQVN